MAGVRQAGRNTSWSRPSHGPLLLQTELRTWGRVSSQHTITTGPRAVGTVTEVPMQRIAGRGRSSSKDPVVWWALGERGAPGSGQWEGSAPGSSVGLVRRRSPQKEQGGEEERPRSRWRVQGEPQLPATGRRRPCVLSRVGSLRGGRPGFLSCLEAPSQWGGGHTVLNRGSKAHRDSRTWGRNLTWPDL